MAFVQNLFPPGCEECASTINRGAYNSVKSRHYDIVHNARGTPAMIEFELQNTCNLKCIMCSAFYSSALMPQELENKHNNIYDKHFVDQLRPYAPHLKFASFVGGEPFLIDLYFDIWTLLTQANPNIKININTNGTILNERVKQMLFQGNFDISLSLDSIVPETYAKIRVNATLSKTLENVRFFYNYCKNKGTIFSIWACPMTLNCFEIPDLLTYFNNMQVPVYFNHVQRPDALTLKSLAVDELKNLSNIYKAFAKQNTANSVVKENMARFGELSAFVEALCVEKESVPEATLVLPDISDLETRLYNMLHMQTDGHLLFQKADDVLKLLHTNSERQKAIEAVLKLSPAKVVGMLNSKPAAFIADYIRMGL